MLKCFYFININLFGIDVDVAIIFFSSLSLKTVLRQCALLQINTCPQTFCIFVEPFAVPHRRHGKPDHFLKLGYIYLNVIASL